MKMSRKQARAALYKQQSGLCFLCGNQMKPTATTVLEIVSKRSRPVMVCRACARKSPSTPPQPSRLTLRFVTRYKIAQSHNRKAQPAQEC